MNNFTTFYIVRHGESESNAAFAKKDQSKNEWPKFGSPLTEKGQLQIKTVSEKLKNVHFDAIFSSDLTRAKQSAEIVALERELAVEARSLLRERSMPSSLSIQERLELNDKIKHKLHQLDEKGKMAYKHGALESIEEAANRMLTFLRETAIAYPGKTIFVASHGNIIRSMLTHLGYARVDELPSGSMENAGYAIIETDGIDFFIKNAYGVTKQKGVMRGW